MAWDDLAGLATVRFAHGDGEALPDFLEAVAGTICGREEALQTRFAARAGGAFVSRVRDAAARAMQIMIAKGMNETEAVEWGRAQGLEATSAAALASAVCAHRETLLEAAGRRASTIATGVLHDFDWSLRVVLASSSCASMTQPVLLLTLSVRDEEHGGATREHVVELPRDALEALVRDFGAIDAVLAKYMPGA